MLCAKTHSSRVSQVHQNDERGVRYTDPPLHDGVVRVHHHSAVRRLFDPVDRDAQERVAAESDMAHVLGLRLRYEDIPAESHVRPGEHRGER